VEPIVPLLLLFPKLRDSFRVAVCRASRGSKWQDGGARETERRRDGYRWCGEGCLAYAEGAGETDTEEEEGSRWGNKRAGRIG